MAVEAGSKSPCVTVIANRRETVDGLRAYFQGVGVASHATQALDEATTVSPATTVVVLFPDEFETSNVVRHISALRKARPSLLVIVVTNSPQFFRPALRPEGHSPSPVVLSKPAFGWTILDVLREYALQEGT